MLTSKLILLQANANGGMAESVLSALQNVANDIMGVITGIAPIALGVAGVFLVWRYGMRFFKSISK